MKFETTIGLEIHVELSTASKMFCGCSALFGGEPNTHTCPVCLGHPGSLPVPNRQAVAYGIMLALALNCEITPRSIFHRKNYFYPDMPKNYQISQYDIPLSSNGSLEIDMGSYSRRVGITRVHLEEDTGKSVHVGESGRIHGADFSLEDFNRAGIPLAEIVTEPHLKSPEEARVFLQSLRSMIVYLGISDCKMEEGSLRCDANISVSADETVGTKVEVKNMNSFKSLYRALAFEEERQRSLLQEGKAIVQETRHWDESNGVAIPLRTKEEAFDYRYFPEPDLVPLEPDPTWVEEIRGRIPELPTAKLERFQSQYGLSRDVAMVLVGEREVANFFERAADFKASPVEIAKWIVGDISAILNEKGISIGEAQVTPQMVGELVLLLDEGTISSKMAKEVLLEVFETGKSPRAIVEEKNLLQITDEEELDKVIDEVVVQNSKAVEDFHAGKEQALKFLIGNVMKKTRGKANPSLVSDMIRRKLSQK